MKYKTFILIFLAFLKSSVFSQTYTEVTEGGWGQGINESDPAVIDIDDDGLLDLIVGCRSGQLYHYEQETAYSTSFKLISESFNGIYVNQGTSIAFTDIDNDGLLDMMVGNVVGNLSHFEQNSNGSTEFTLITTKFNDIDVGTRCLPSFTDLDNDGLLDMLIGEDEGNLNHYEQDSPGSSTFNLVSETFCDINVGEISKPCFTDLENDGLLDLIIGSDDGLIHHYEQDAINSESFIIVSDTLSGIVINNSSKPYVTDLDGNGLLDMIVGSYNGDLFHYEQDGVGTLTFSMKTKRLVQIDVLKLGAQAHPVLIDLDGDGLLDLIKGADDHILHYEQDAVGSSYFTLISENFIKIEMGYAAPCIMDLDGNGQLDMLIGTWSGIIHYEQDAPNLTTFTEISNEPCGMIDFYAATPCISDLDNNGRLDLIIGNTQGTIYHYQQDSVGAATFTLITDTFNDINIGGYSSPTFTDLDNDGLLDLIIGTRFGTLVHYEQTAVSSMEFNLITDNFNNMWISNFVHPEFADINGDGVSDLIVGEAYGGVHYFQRTDASRVEKENRTPLIFKLYNNYPNPFNPATTIKYELSQSSKVTISIYNMLGQEIVTLEDIHQQTGSYSVQWDGKDKTGHSLPGGIYICNMSAGKYNQSIKLLLLN